MRNEGGRRIIDYIESIESADLQSLMLATHEFIADFDPRIISSLKYKVPFYSYLKDLCYINLVRDHLYVGFVRAWQMHKNPFLDYSGTKRIAKYYIRMENDIHNRAFSDLLLEAMILNENQNR